MLYMLVQIGCGINMNYSSFISLSLTLFQSERGSALLPLTQALINLKEQQEIAEVSSNMLLPHPA